MCPWHYIWVHRCLCFSAAYLPPIIKNLLVDKFVLWLEAKSWDPHTSARYCFQNWRIRSILILQWFLLPCEIFVFVSLSFVSCGKFNLEKRGTSWFASAELQNFFLNLPKRVPPISLYSTYKSKQREIC